MRPITRFFLYSFLLFVFFLLLLRPYNWICQTSGACNKFYLSDLIPTVEGTETINITLETKNHRDDIDFTIEGYDTFTTVSGRRNIITYHVKNLSTKKAFFRPKYYAAPSFYEQYINRTDCLCFEEHEVEAGEEVILKVSFEIDSDIEEDDMFWSEDQVKDITIGYTMY